jgi:hypothetical protein
MKLFLGFLFLATGVAAAAVQPPRSVESLVVPILDLRAQAESSQGEAQQSAFTKSEKLTGRLFQIHTRAADEALVLLMNFYVGEALQSDLVHEVTKRGKRMLPLLMKYQHDTVHFSKRSYPVSLLVANDVRTNEFETAIQAVKSGKVIGED